MICLLPSPLSVSRRLRWCCRGFTFSEMMVANAIGSLIVAGVLATYLFSVKGFRAVAHYAEIHADGRHAIDVFARDMRAVNRVLATSPSNLVVSIPTAFTTTGLISDSKTITYWLQDEAVYRYDAQAGSRSLLATNVYELDFSLYDRLGSNTTALAGAKGVQVHLKLRKHVIGQIQSEDYLSARLEMRNKS